MSLLFLLLLPLSSSFWLFQYFQHLLHPLPVPHVLCLKHLEWFLFYLDPDQHHLEGRVGEEAERHSVEETAMSKPTQVGELGRVLESAESSHLAGEW